MTGVTHFTEALLEAVECELTVGVPFTNLETGLDIPPSHSTGLPSWLP